MRQKRAMAAAVVALAVAAGGTGVALGTDHDNGVAGSEADLARAAAVRYTHGGTAGVVERDNEHGATWGVEVTRSDGARVDVRLDAKLNLVEITSNQDDEG